MNDYALISSETAIQYGVGARNWTEFLDSWSSPAKCARRLSSCRSRIIADLGDKPHDAKRNRQLLFASHNSNIVVNGSSQLVGRLDTGENGDRQFDCMGAIDEPVVCEIITKTMEGGEKAFKDRQDKYGF